MPYIFLHIPKAGGSTLLEILTLQFGQRHLFDLEDRFRESVDTTQQKITKKNDFWLETSRDEIFAKRLQDFQQLTDSQRSDIQLIRGHYAFNYYQNIPNFESANYFTMLRNPTDRLISHYSFARENSWHYLHELVLQQNLSFHDYLKLPIPELHNGMVRLVIGKETEIELTDNHLAEAIQILESRFIHMGIIEMFDESLFLLGKVLNWNNIPAYVKTNITENKIAFSEVPTETVQLIERNNSLDIQLYQWAKEQFIKKWQQFPELDFALRCYKQKNKLYGHWNRLKFFLKRSFS